MTIEGNFGELFTVVTSRAKITRDLLAMAKFLAFLNITQQREKEEAQNVYGNWFIVSPTIVQG